MKSKIRVAIESIGKFTLLALVPISLAVVPAALAQSANGAHASSPSALFGLGVFHGTKSASSESGPDAVRMGLAAVKAYRFASADFPGTPGSLVFDENTKTATVLGDTIFSGTLCGVACGSGVLNGFTFKGGIYKQFSIPGSQSNEITGINSAGDIVGTYIASGVQHGFFEISGTVCTLDILGEVSTFPMDINDNNQIVGTVQDASSIYHGFIVTPGVGCIFSSSTFDANFPNVAETMVGGVNFSGVISGTWVDGASNKHGFTLANNTTFTSLDFPLAAQTSAIGINDSNEVAGYYVDTAGVNHGFVYSSGNFINVDVPIASGTQLTRIKNTGPVTGLYLDSAGETHGVTGH